jgi:hypothetical protein
VPRAVAEQWRDGVGVARLGSGGQAEFVEADDLRMEVAGEEEVGVERGRAHGPGRGVRLLAGRTEIEQQHALPGDATERGGELPGGAVGIEARGKREQGHDPAHPPVAERAWLSDHRLGEAPGEAGIRGAKSVQLTAGDAQQDCVRDHDGGVAVRLAIEEGAFAERVANAPNLAAPPCPTTADGIRAMSFLDAVLRNTHPENTEKWTRLA